MSILVLTSDTLIGTAAAGNIEYNGQFYGTDSNASRAQMQRIVQETAQATTSGTSKDFTGIPAWVKRITVMFSGVSTNGTSLQIIRLGTSGGIETTGYVGTATTNGSTVSSTVGVLVGYRGDAANVYSGAIVFTLLNASSNLWVAQGVNSGAGGSTGDCSSVGATKTLSGTLDRVRITTVNGTDTFDAGSINILYEG